MKKYSYLLALLFMAAIPASSQEIPYLKDIKEFRRQDSINPPPADPIVFVGSSSFTLWKNMQEMFPEHTVINRGFGGSTLVDFHRFLPDLVYKYNPKQLVIYSGENDLANPGISPDTVFNRFTTVFNLIRKKFPNLPIVYVSIKPSPSRAQYASNMVETNKLIRGFLKKKKKAVFVDVYSLMINADGKAKPELFIADNLHINQDGYKIWQKAIQPHLVKNK